MIRVLDIDKINYLDLNLFDPSMKTFDIISKLLEEDNNVQIIKQEITFETPVNVYNYKGIVFSLLFDEMIDEPFISIEKKYDYKPIVDLIEPIIDKI